jgi:hypothetical protein
MLQQVERVQERAAQIMLRLASADRARHDSHARTCAADTTRPAAEANTLGALRVRERAVRALADYRAAAARFRDAAAMSASASLSQITDPAENRRLAHAFREGYTPATAAPELAGTAEVLDLGKDYFAGTAGKNGERTAALGAISALRQLLADEIARGGRPMLKPAFKQEYEAFKRDYCARRRLAARTEKSSADRYSSQDHER